MSHPIKGAHRNDPKWVKRLHKYADGGSVATDDRGWGDDYTNSPMPINIYGADHNVDSGVSGGEKTETPPDRPVKFDLIGNWRSRKR